MYPEQPESTDHMSHCHPAKISTKHQKRRVVKRVFLLILAVQS